jgi:hypothetical protein
MREVKRLHGFVAVAVLTLGGCAWLLDEGHDRSPDPGEAVQQTQWAQPERSAEAEISALASFADTVSLLTAESQRQVLDAAELDYEHTGGAVARLRLALLLTLADKELQDLERARELFAQSAVAPEHPAHIGLSQLLEMLVTSLQAEQRHGRNLLAAERARCQAATEQARCEALEEQLQRLKDIERQMNERAQRPTLPMDDENEPRQDPPGG